MTTFAPQAASSQRDIILIELDGVCFRPSSSDGVPFLLPALDDADDQVPNLGYDVWVEAGKAICQALVALHGDRVLFMTSRPEEARSYTLSQLHTLLGGREIQQHQLLMRPNEDSSGSGSGSGSEFKFRLDQLLKHGISPDRLLLVFEVRSALVKAWRKLGVTCYQTSFGDY